MHRVTVAALDGVIPFDLSTPCEVFGRARLPDGSAPYRVRVCGVRRLVDAGLFQMRTRWGLGELGRADTLIVPGVVDPTLPIPRALVKAIRATARNGARIASICTGAFIL